MDDANPQAEAAEETAGAAPVADDRPRWRRALSAVPIELWVLFALAALTRFVFLQDPRSIVFDEIYFREYALHYKAGTYYFDLHPPLGKELLGLWAAIAGVDATAINKDPAVAMRILPAFCGTLLIPVFYVFVRHLSRSRRVATLAASLLLLESAILVESRLIVMDSMLLLFGLSAVTCALLARERTGRAHWALMVGAATFGGLALSIKLTGLAAFGLVGVVWLTDIFLKRREWRAHWKRVLAQAVMLLAIPATIYMGAIAIHFALLTKSGPGDWTLPPDIVKTLEGADTYDPNAHVSFLRKFRALNSTIHEYELAMSTSTHPYASKWTTWPINKRGIYTYYENVGNGKSRYIYSFGNPVIWWGILVAAVGVLIGAVWRPSRLKPIRWQLALLGLAWAVNWFPFAFIERPMFLYHYFFALIFSLAFVVMAGSALVGWDRDGDRPFSFPSRRSRFGFWAVIGAALLSFLYFSPVIYGLPLDEAGFNSRLWLSSWR